ncbi:YwiC-like family protein [Bacillus carboniphilus]|uniref:YwiC-like family protein n=1 Tax=Bacillus carboniphilus TaxID=86663 RepID=UPI003531884B
MKPFIPKQHGAWAMLIVPFVLGMALSSFTWVHVPLFLGWLFLYLASYPLLMLTKGKKKEFYRKWAITYGALALLFLIIVVIFNWKMIFFWFCYDSFLPY